MIIICNLSLFISCTRQPWLCPIQLATQDCSRSRNNPPGILRPKLTNLSFLSSTSSYKIKFINKLIPQTPVKNWKHLLYFHLDFFVTPSSKVHLKCWPCTQMVRTLDMPRLSVQKRLQWKAQPQPFHKHSYSH